MLPNWLCLCTFHLWKSQMPNHMRVRVRDCVCVLRRDCTHIWLLKDELRANLCDRKHICRGKEREKVNDNKELNAHRTFTKQTQSLIPTGVWCVYEKTHKTLFVILHSLFALLFIIIFSRTKKDWNDSQFLMSIRYYYVKQIQSNGIDALKLDMRMNVRDD